MKKGQVLFLVGLLAILAILVFVKKSQVPPEVVKEEYAETVVDFQDDQSLEAIELHKGTEEQPSLRLVRTGEEWRMPLRWDMPVQKNKVEDSLNMLKKLKGEVRGDNEALFSDFGIKDEDAFHVRLKGAEEKELLHLLLGTEKPRYGSSFVRLAGSAKVYLVDYNLMVTFGITSGDLKTVNEKHWVDLKVIDFNNTDVTGIRIEKLSDKGSPGIIELGKSTDAESGLARWSFARQDLPFAVDAGKASSYLDELKRVTGTDFHDPAGAGYGFDNFYMKIALNADTEDKKKLVTIGGTASAETESRYAQVGVGRPVYTLSKYSIETIDVDESYFFPSNPLGIDKEKLNSVTIHKPEVEKKIEGEKFEEESGLVTALKEFSVARLLNESEGRKVKARDKYWIEVEPKEGEPLQLDVGEALGEEKEEYVARLRNGTAAFAISKSVYQKLFEF